METYTTADAARLTGSSVRALRKRIERGSLRAVKRDDGWRIPRSELERAGLRIGAPAETSDIVRELTETIRRQERELVALRALPERVESARQDHDREVEARQAAEAMAAQERAIAAEAREWRERAARAGWRERRRMLREARAA
jgi:excisionase family DNA binding protein